MYIVVCERPNTFFLKERFEIPIGVKFIHKGLTQSLKDTLNYKIESMNQQSRP